MRCPAGTSLHKFQATYVKLKESMESYIINIYVLTSLFLKANMTAPACSAALPTIDSKIMLMKLTDKPHESDASCLD